MRPSEVWGPEQGGPSCLSLKDGLFGVTHSGTVYGWDWDGLKVTGKSVNKNSEKR